MPLNHPDPSPIHTIWLRDHKAAFVYLPKVACTSWKLYLWQALGHALPSGFDYRHVHDTATLPLPYVTTLPTHSQLSFREDLSHGTIATYAVIREPKARILSAYLDKIEHHANPRSYFSTVVIPEIQHAAGLDAATRPSFASFLAWIADQPDRHALNDHWRPMTSILGTTEASTYTRLWTMERMDQAIALFATLLETSIPFPGRQHLGARRTYDSQTRLNAYYGPTECDLFDQIYAQDVLLHQQVSGD
jgi:hypothetical protein